MRLEFHQLERRLEHIQVHWAERHVLCQNAVRCEMIRNEKDSICNHMILECSKSQAFIGEMVSIRGMRSWLTKPNDGEWGLN